jgi:cell division transport system permease protein
MKSIRDHTMFILPLVAILLGVEFFLVFHRLTGSYEEKLRKSYTILIVSKRAISEMEFKSVDNNIESVVEIPKERITKSIMETFNTPDSLKAVDAMPHFFKLRLNKYLNNDDVKKVKEKILKIDGIKSVRTFRVNHNAKYNLFMFIKFLFWTFVSIMSLVSVLLIIKQMEVWQMAHSRRMQIMEIFGAPILLRSGVLFKMGVFDALISVVLGSGIFLMIKHRFVPESTIEILTKNRELIFQWWDAIVMFGVSFSIVTISVIVVTFSSKGVEE